jgi:DNA-directed RNA polymerase subunit E'/Rpb7
MFRLVTIEEVVQVPPRLFGLDRFEAMEIEVNRKYCNKVLSGVGVCVALWDWVSAKDHRLVPHTGDANTSCIFRMLVFAPQAGEILRGTVAACDKDGIEVDLGFVGGFSIAKPDMPPRSVYLADDHIWNIIHSTDDAEAEASIAEAIPGLRREAATVEGIEETKCGEEIASDEDVEVVRNYLDVSDSINFEVLRVDFADGVDKPPEDPKKEATRAQYIMKVRGALRKSGLGPHIWWANIEEGDEEEEAEDDEPGGDGYGDDEVGDLGELDKFNVRNFLEDGNEVKEEASLPE